MCAIMSFVFNLLRLDGCRVMALKDVIFEIRKKHGLSQEDMAGRLFVTRQAVSRWENGETTPALSTLKSISLTFGVDAATLLGLSEPPICQSCAALMRDIDNFGTNADGTATTEYCSYCYRNGVFSRERSIEEMAETNLRFLDRFNAENGTCYTEDEARKILKTHIASLKRWRNE
jgi:transcriptional regulator with XRE-family HTH domain